MKNRHVILSAGIVIQCILGGVYAWSVFVPYLSKGYGLTKAQCGNVFGLSIAVFTIAMIAAGRLLPRLGPRLTAGFGAVLFAAGYAVASLSGGRYGLIVLGIGVLSGAGIGFGYFCPLTVGMQWFPKHKGLITGIAVAGFGGGAILLSAVASAFLDREMDVLTFFGWIAVVPGTILLISAALLAVPDQTDSTSGELPRIAAGWKSPAFLVCTLGMFAGTFAGLLVVGNLAPIALDNGLSGATAVRGVSAFAVGNAVGRILWGALFDRVHERAIPLSLILFAACLTLLPWTGGATGFLLISVALGFGFGSNFVIYASSISRQFGVDVFARLYPICFLAYGFAGTTGPGLGGKLADITGSYSLPVYLSTGVLVLAALVTWRGLVASGIVNRRTAGPVPSRLKSA